MTVSELIKELKKYPKDAKVVFVEDWDEVNDNGLLTKCKEFESTTSQTWFDDTGFDRDYTEVIIC